MRYIIDTSGLDDDFYQNNYFFHEYFYKDLKPMRYYDVSVFSCITFLMLDLYKQGISYDDIIPIRSSICTHGSLVRTSNSIFKRFFSKVDSGWMTTTSYQVAKYKFTEEGKVLFSSLNNRESLYYFHDKNKDKRCQCKILTYAYKEYNSNIIESTNSKYSKNLSSNEAKEIGNILGLTYTSSSDYTKEFMPKIREYYRERLTLVSIKEKNPFSSINSETLFNILNKHAPCQLYHSAIIDTNAIEENLLLDSVSESDKLKLRQLDRSTNDGISKLLYLDTLKSPRLYEQNTPLQYMSKSMRKKVLSEYRPIDISSSIYSILLNYADKLGYSGNLFYIRKMCYNSGELKNVILYDLQKSDPSVSSAYIKTNLIALAYGANMNVKYVDTDSYFHCFNSVPVVTPGYTNTDTPSNFVDHYIVSKLRSELKELVQWIISVNIIYTNGKRFLRGISGNLLEITPKMRFGKKLAYIYQSIEVSILKIMVKYIYDKFNSDYLMGLALHDGIYVHKSIATPELPTELIEEIKNKCGFDLVLVYE